MCHDWRVLDRSTTSISSAVLIVLQATTAFVAVSLVVGLPWLAHPEVVPLTLLTAAVLLIPLWRDERAGAFDLAEPFTLSVLSVAFWHFVVGSAAYAFGLQDDVFYLERIEDRAAVTVVVTQSLILVGLTALGLAARCAPAARAGEWVTERTPRGPVRSRDLQVLTWTLLGIGLVASLIGRAEGTIGYVAASSGAIGAVTGFASMLAAAAPVTFTEAWGAGASRRASIAMGSGIVVVILVQSLVAGNRGTAMAFALTALVALGRRHLRFSTRKLLVGGVAATALLALTVAYGSAYRDVATQADGTVTDDVLANAQDAIVELFDRGPGIVGYVTERVTERLDSTISTSVVVAQFDELGAEERRAGIDNDIVETTAAALVPRWLWPDKPSSNPQVLGEVYFGFPNAYATTPISTLLRNFGPWSVAIGMAIVGGAMGVLYRALAAPGTWTAARAVVYLLIVTRATNLEGSLATFVPDASRLVIMCLAAFLISWGISRALDRAFGEPDVGQPPRPRTPSAEQPPVAAYSLRVLAASIVGLTFVAGLVATAV